MHERFSSPAQWAQISSELWERIFWLARTLDSRYEMEHIFMDQEDRQEQAWLHQLRTVCKSFATIIDQDPSFFRDLVMFENIGHSQMPSLLQYIERHGKKVEHVASTSSSPWVAAALSALQPHRPELDTAHFLANITQTAVLLLPAFPTLQRITLCGPLVGSLNLDALQFLSELSHLHLQDGRFEGVEFVEHLTRLRMTSAKAFCSSSCEFASCLQDLELENSKLIDFHHHGLSACRQLANLDCDNSSVSSSSHNLHQDMQFGSDLPLREPSSMLSLTALTSLSIGVNNTAGHLQLDWVRQITSLVILCIKGEVSQVDFPSDLTLLTNLRTFRFQSRSGQAQCDLDWSAFASLQRVWLSGVLHLSKRLTSLATVQSLVHLKLSGLRPCDAVSTAHVAALITKLRQDRSDVCIQDN